VLRTAPQSLTENYVADFGPFQRGDTGHARKIGVLSGHLAVAPEKRPQRRALILSQTLRMRSEVFRTLVALLPLLLALSTSAAHAHAFLDRAEPRVGNTVKSPPRTVALWFTQNLESTFSAIEVRDANGVQMNAGKASVDTNDRKLLRVPLKALSAGTYTVRWHVLSVDTHTTEGNFTFHVAP
jgi:copper resistance protein C